MRSIKRIVKRIPILVQLYYKLTGLTIAGRPASDIFRDIYLENRWGGRRSVSGRGSDIEQTAYLSAQIPSLFRDLGINSVLDIPCGDFYWMRSVDLSGIVYTGGDIVESLVKKNQELYGSGAVRFAHLDLLVDDLPKADLIFCRDCLVHLSHGHVFKALERIAESGAKYFMTTTFPDRLENCDITTGQWRPLNLQVEPFSFPEPIRIINEGCSENGGDYSDKSMALWSLASVKGALDSAGANFRQ